MSRQMPWRSKPTQLIKDMIEAVKDYKLYLVSQTGPFSFVFKDDNDNKFKVTIGSVLKCSCGVMPKDHCIHTVFVLLKRFKVDENNPILWQQSYVDSELQGLMSFKYVKKAKSTVIQVKKNIFRKNVLADDQSQISQIADDQTCPICYMDLKQQCFSTCTQCKNHLHTKCFKIWIKHKLQNNDKVTCPLCRNLFMNPMGIVSKDLDRWQKKFTVHKGTKCHGCGIKNISGDIYHCVICQQLNLCKYCYIGNQHNSHDRFLTKNMTKQNWRIALARQVKTSKKFLQPQKQIQFVQPTQFQLIQFLVDSIHSVKQLQHIQLNSASNNGGFGLNIIGNDMRHKTKNICKQCNQISNDEIKKLNCGHTIHDFCIMKIYQNNNYYCPCGEPILSGYISALGLKQKKNEIQKSQKCQKIFFNKSQEPNFIQTKQKLSVQKPVLQKHKVNHFRVRKSTIERKPLMNTELTMQINNMPIRTRSVFRS